MNTEALINLMMEWPQPGEWVRFLGTSRGETAYHWFCTSKKGGRIVFHKVEETGTPEGLSQDSMINYYRRFSWTLA